MWNHFLVQFGLSFSTKLIQRLKVEQIPLNQLLDVTLHNNLFNISKDFPRLDNFRFQEQLTTFASLVLIWDGSLGWKSLGFKEGNLL